MAADILGQPRFPMTGCWPAGPAGARFIDMPPVIITEFQVTDYAGAARKVMHGRDGKVGVVLSVVRMLPADGRPLVESGTAAGPRRPVLARPPAYVVQPPEVFTVSWRGTDLRYVWVLSNERAKYPVGGILFLPSGAGVLLHVVTFNVGDLDDGRRCTNAHHAEMQAVRWIDEQPLSWRARLGGIGIWNLSRRSGLGYSPCRPCCADLARFLGALPSHAPAASITWRTTYGRNAACGHPTDTASLRRLAASGWQLSGPGWPPP